MVDVAPFCALRYEHNKEKDISKYICPPYDVISPEARKKLVQASAHNVVQLELPSENGQDKYARARALLLKWEESNILQRDRVPSFYLLETTFRIQDPFAPKAKLKRYGVLLGLHLEVPGKGKVRPHERTLPKAKEDRLNLIKAVQTNTSPIYGLFFDPQKKWNKWVKKVIKSKPIVKGHEKKDLDHRMWKVDNENLIKGLKDLLKSKELFIADGHHRYEVAWAYKVARLKSQPRASLNQGWNSVMTYVCPMEEKGVLMLPTHRLVRSLHSVEEWTRHLEACFEIKKVASIHSIIKTLAAQKPKKGKRERIIGWVNCDGNFLLKLKKDISVDLCLAHRPAALRELDVVLLHDMVCGEAQGGSFLEEKEIVNTRDIQLIRKKTRDPQWVGFILSSAGVDALARVADAGEVMPPKTTYFYPKVPTGFTLMPLDQVLD